MTTPLLASVARSGKYTIKLYCATGRIRPFHCQVWRVGSRFAREVGRTGACCTPGAATASALALIERDRSIPR